MKYEKNTIYNGNCRELLNDKTFIKDNSVHLIVTSPPYSDRRKSTYGGIHPKEYVEWFLPLSEQMLRIRKPQGSLIVNIKEHVKNGERQTYVLELILAMNKQGWKWTEEYCWYKKTAFPGKWPNRFRDSWERCLHFTKEKKFYMNQDAVKVPIGDWAEKRFKSMSENDFIRYTSGTNKHLGKRVANWMNKRKVYPHNVLVFEKEHYSLPSNVLELCPVTNHKNHSACFPLELPAWFIRLLSKKNDLVLDPFIGVGTTALACRLLGRNYIGIEKQKEYVKEANQNIQELEQEISSSKRKYQQ